MDLHEGPNGGGRYGGGLSRRMIVERVEMSLRRLNTDHVDFLYAQSVDRNTPLEVTMRAFDDLVRQGKVLYYGLSNFPAWMMVDAVRIAQVEHLAPIIGQEIAYSLVRRTIEADLVPACRHFGLGLTIHTPLGGGLLAGAQTVLGKPPTEVGFRRWQQGEGPGFTEGELQVAAELDAYARDWGEPAPALALSWLLSKPAVASVIIGPETIDELEKSITGGSLHLDEEQLRKLDQLGPS
jgi:aryl-alcohol dehydrogenase-like predicted oxidoreductase